MPVILWDLFYPCAQARAKHDTTNTVVAGCVTGGSISAKGRLFTLVSKYLPHFLSQM